MRLHRLSLVTIAIVAIPIYGLAQRGNLTNQQPATQDAAVDFGVFAPVTVPLGPPPCLQPTIPPAPPAGIGGPNDPCSYKLHHLTPEEVTILNEGEVTFQIHGGGHAFAIYEVSKDTTRDEIGQFLCPGPDPGGIADPTLHTCNLSATNSNGAHVVTDGHGAVVITATQNITNAHPDNRVWSPSGRLMSAGGRQFLNGGTIAAGPTSDGQLITYRFRKNGRYLVICMNRTHFLNDWMFGFVNVAGQ